MQRWSVYAGNGARAIIGFLSKQVKAMEFKPPRILGHRRLTDDALGRLEKAVVVAPTLAALARLPFGAVLTRQARRLTHSADKVPLIVDLPNEIGTRVAAQVLSPSTKPFALLTAARALIAAHQAPARGHLAIVVDGFAARDAARVSEALVAAALAAAAVLPRFGRRAETPHRLRELHIYGAPPAERYARTVAEAKGNALARYLTLLPANVLTPRAYRTKVQALARDHGWRTQFLDLRRLRRARAGAFLAVVQGSPDRDGGILHLRYSPPRRRHRRGEPPAALALVGKGVCFDTGGVNLKGASYMYGMHGDMQGSAVALGSLLALSELKVDFPIECWLALAQNHIGPKAYKPNDVVVAANGLAIEVVNTDAEGRMLLADTLALASRARPRLIIDYATLTGACVRALGNRMSGVMTNRPELIPTLIETGAASGERVWPFPLEPDYEEELKSEIADIKQCALGADADHILAAVFLGRFIAHDCPWVHLDLAARKHKGGLAHIPTEVSGFGVRYTLSLLLEQRLLARLP